MLEEQRLVKLVDPQSELMDYGETFSSAVRKDLYSNLYSKLDSRPFRLYADKLTKELFREFFAKASWLDADTLSVPFDVGEAVIMNHVISLCYMHHLVPFTDENAQRLALLSKIRLTQETNRIMSKPLEFDFVLPALSGLIMDDVLALRKDKSLQNLRNVISDFSYFAQSQPLDACMWRAFSGKLETIEKGLNTIKETLQGFKNSNPRERIGMAKMDLKITVYVGTPLSSQPFVSQNNGISFFIDPKRLIPDPHAIRSISRIIEGTSKEPQKKIEKGKASAEDLIQTLKMRPRS
jgi:hypothetical protein